MKQQKNNDDRRLESKDQQKGMPEQKTGINSPDTDEAAADNVQESEFGHRSYASPDFFRKKPHL